MKNKFKKIILNVLDDFFPDVDLADSFESANYDDSFLGTGLDTEEKEILATAISQVIMKELGTGHENKN